MGELVFVSVVVVAVIILLVFETLPPSVAMLAGMVVVMLFGVITPEQALAGFSNPAPITVAALYVLARAVDRTGALVPLVRGLLGKGRRSRHSLARLLAPVAGASGFLNNTPIVAMLLPSVRRWCDDNGLSPSRFLMPLSFAAMLGGTMTIIGTSTNIVVSGLMIDAGMPRMGFFELGLLGLPVVLVGVPLIVWLAPIVLPVRQSVRQEVDDEGRRFVVEMQVENFLDGVAVKDAGLGHLETLYVSSIMRDGEQIAPVGPTTILRAGDQLQLAGRVVEVLELPQVRGLSSAAPVNLVDLDPASARYFEAVLGANSPLVGRTLKSIDFRSQYAGVVLAIHRAGHLVEGKLGVVPLHAGDTILVLADPGFAERWRDRRDFLVIQDSDHTPPVRSWRAVLVGVIVAAIVVLASTGLLPILQATMVAGIALLVTGVLSPTEARDAVDFDVVILIAAAFGLATAVSVSGLADLLANATVDVFGVFGPRGVLAGVVIASVGLTVLITNNAAALLMFPIAMAIAQEVGADPRGYAAAVAVGASFAFLTPIGYQTNMMVYGPGGYRFSDFFRLGAPLTVVVVILVVAIVPIVWP